MQVNIGHRTVNTAVFVSCNYLRRKKKCCLLQNHKETLGKNMDHERGRERARGGGGGGPISL